MLVVDKFGYGICMLLVGCVWGVVMYEMVGLVVVYVMEVLIEV